jgi:copper oxidase (laccase) domain-containing protein
MKTVIEVSTVADGSMSPSDDSSFANRQRFLTKHGIAPERAVLVRLVYEGDNYCRYDVVGANDGGMGIIGESFRINDALFTREKDLALFLPLADCIGAVLVDKRRQILGLSHLGRHNLEQFGARRSVEYMKEHFGSNPADITIYMSPAAGRESYPLFAFDHRSLHDVASEQFVQAGILSEHIRIAEEDTTKHPEYFSHSEYLKGKQINDGRHAIVAQLTA